MGTARQHTYVLSAPRSGRVLGRTSTSTQRDATSHAVRLTDTGFTDVVDGGGYAALMGAWAHLPRTQRACRPARCRSCDARVGYVSAGSVAASTWPWWAVTDLWSVSPLTAATGRSDSASSWETSTTRT
jgi:hypothetical protein